MDNYYLLFDLDGTLVNTDDIYIEVWNEILNKYKINCNKIFFNHFIKGKNDSYFLKYILSNINEEEIIKISKLKDELFIKKLKNKNILLDGVIEFLDDNKDNKIAIVTSCNKTAAEYILKITNINKYVDLLITSQDCEKHKPNPEPYLNAIKKLNADINKTIIFEDSYSGYLSAKHSNVKNICLIENKESCTDILNSNEFKINNYNNLIIKQIIEYKTNQDYNNSYINEICNNINSIPIQKIEKCNKNLKTGYICDINNYDVTYINGIKESIILKISNLDNELSNTATKLNMYENETYFYENISNLITNIPKFLGSFQDNQKEAIILENLNKYEGEFNINLNTNTRLLLNVVTNIFNIHNTFHFINEESIIPFMKKLKKVNQILYYKELIDKRFHKFIEKVNLLLNEKELNILKNIYSNLDKIYNESSSFPLNFCHGDLKSPNIFYKNNEVPIFLDWQYIQLNKGVSDIIFLLIESIEFDEITVNLVLNYYFKLIKEKHNISYESYMNDVRNSLCIFPFFVCVWFNSEDNDKLLDPVFPIRFLKDLMKYYNYFFII